MTSLASMFMFLSTKAVLKYRDAVILADAMTREDANAYAQIWKVKLAAPGARESLEQLKQAWDETMAAAAHFSKKQPRKFGSIEELFLAADRLNSYFHLKMEAHARAHGGKFKGAPVKNEDRALQKIYRSYQEDWRRCSDLNRCAIVFDSFEGIAKALRGLALDPEVVVLKVGDEKMRLSERYDAEALSAGYRDVQVCIRIRAAWTLEQGLDGVLCEVQLHDKMYFARKSLGGGHKSYVQRVSQCTRATHARTHRTAGPYNHHTTARYLHDLPPAQYACPISPGAAWHSAWGIWARSERAARFAFGHRRCAIYQRW
mmetsp:Transcript_98902/g.282810  ORF Transcript_98902/g.282810 Transcript_98902/m.282810 type:complete len:316 (+) Transcript_98902:1277-2224(+)